MISTPFVSFPSTFSRVLYLRWSHQCIRVITLVSRSLYDPRICLPRAVHGWQLDILGRTKVGGRRWGGCGGGVLISKPGSHVRVGYRFHREQTEEVLPMDNLWLNPAIFFMCLSGCHDIVHLYNVASDINGIECGITSPDMESVNCYPFFLM